MPYVDQKTREELEGVFSPENPGELNYKITCLILNYIETKGLKYSTINDIVGVLDCAKMEFYRRIAIPYEDKKIEENGDVYDEY